LALVVFLLSGNPWQAAPGNSSGPVLGPPFVASLWSQDDRTVVAASDKDAEDADTDKKDPPEGKDDEDPRLKELWDSPMLG
jgi:hypothetical protein